jgi:hypothetical protein
MNIYVIEWRYINTSYMEEKQTYIIRTVDIEQAVTRVKSLLHWNTDKETNSTFYGWNALDMTDRDIVVLGEDDTLL